MRAHSTFSPAITSSAMPLSQSLHPSPHGGSSKYLALGSFAPSSEVPSVSRSACLWCVLLEDMSKISSSESVRVNWIFTGEVECEITGEGMSDLWKALSL